MSFLSSMLYFLVTGMILFFFPNFTNAQMQSINMHEGSVTTSFANFYDSGGEYSNYQDDEYMTITIYPENPSEKLCVTFHEFQTQAGSSSDVLYVYDGNSTSAPQIASMSGINYGTVSSSASDGSLTFQFISNSSTNYFGWAASITVDNTPEDITMIGDATWYISSGRFYDNGGPNNDYSNNSDVTVTLFPENSTEKLSVTFHEFYTQPGTSGDVLYAYNGNNTSAPLIAQLSGDNYGTIISSASDGSLTFQFVSNASNNNSGWYASIGTESVLEDVTMMANGTFTVTGKGGFYDNGGPQNDYGDNQYIVTTLKPENPSDKLSVTFHSFNTQENSDVLTVFDGDNIGAPLIGSYSGDLTVFTVTSTASDGSLTFQFASDGSNNNYGWFASINTSSSVPSYNMTTNTTHTIPGGTSAYFYDSGGPNSNYSNNEDVVVTFEPENSSDKLSISFDYFRTYHPGDYLEIHDGNSVTAPLLVTLDRWGGYGTITATSSNPTGSLTFRFVSNSVQISGGWAATVNTNTTPKNISMPGTYTLPTGDIGYFYDIGGPGGNYIDNMDAVTTIMPVNSSDKLSVSFDYFRTYHPGDYLEIHDGNSVTAPLLVTLDRWGGYGTITATSSNPTGSLTFRFVSNSVQISGGWAATVNTNTTPKNISMPGTYTLPTGDIGYFYDIGGPGGNYIDNMDAVTTIMPVNSSDKLSVSFDYFRTYHPGDYLEIHDGNSVTAPLLVTLDRWGGYGTITATSSNPTGSLTFRFVSNSVQISGGWAVTINTNTTPKNISMPGTYTLPTGDIGYFYDIGGPGGNYIDNMDAVTTIIPENSSDTLSVSFSHFNTYHSGDYLEIYDGNSVTAPLLGTFSGNTNPGTIKPSTTNASGSLTFRFVSNSVQISSGWGAVVKSIQGPTDVEEDQNNTEIPSTFALEQNYPNPFNPTTTINFDVPHTTNVLLKVCDVLGNEIVTLVNEELSPGNYKATFDGSGLSSGAYFYRMQAGDFVEIKKLVLQK